MINYESKQHLLINTIYNLYRQQSPKIKAESFTTKYQILTYQSRVSDDQNSKPNHYLIFDYRL